MADRLLKEYDLIIDEMKANVKIVEKENEFVKIYWLDLPEFGEGTEALMKNIKQKLLVDSSIRTDKMLDPKFIDELKGKFREKAVKIIQRELPAIDEKSKISLIAVLLNDMLGLGKVEFLLSDGNLEEIVINSAKEPLWIYHKEFGWLKTNVTVESEAETQNYASIIARRVGKQITTLNPLLDAHLITGDRANATLFPISGAGNTITIRRFRRDPWTVTDFIKNNTVSSEMMALIWLSMQFELNIILSGGTASGKTSFLNVCLPFIQPNHRIISIEDTREIALPEFLHWVPMTTREPNPEGKGAVQMIDLLVNSLRMRPDRIIVGEVRRQREAEVMFEAMHTGHSVYTTVHANTSEETIRRLTNPPIEIPAVMLEAVHLNVVMFRNRRLGVRRVLEVGEFVPEKVGAEKERVKANILYRWKPGIDKIEKHADSIRLFDELSLHTGLIASELGEEILKKQRILDWMVKNDLRSLKDVGRVMATYYMHPEEIEEMVQKNKTWKGK
ncbi:MAG: ATPase, T2SS/T4P/T4SS family [Candidatus Diapherotrites archaeon]